MNSQVYLPFADSSPPRSGVVANPPLSRQKRIDQALAKQSAEFKKAFRLYAEGYWSMNSSTVADVVASYKRTDFPKPVSKDYRCVGGIIQSMLKQGQIESVGTQKAADGSGRNMDVYSKKK